MVASMGRNGFGMYFFFGAVSACAVLFTWWLVPETKSVPLDRMDRLFEVRPVRKARGVVMGELEVENWEGGRGEKGRGSEERVDGV